MLEELIWWISCRPCVSQAAGAIHTDFERGFICAEVMHYEELHELGCENAVKAAGKYRQEVRASTCHAVHPGFRDMVICSTSVLTAGRHALTSTLTSAAESETASAVVADGCATCH